jgi:hypothetical protein
MPGISGIMFELIWLDQARVDAPRDILFFRGYIRIFFAINDKEKPCNMYSWIDAKWASSWAWGSEVCGVIEKAAFINWGRVGHITEAFLGIVLGQIQLCRYGIINRRILGEIPYKLSDASYLIAFCRSPRPHQIAPTLFTFSGHWDSSLVCEWDS